MNEIKKDVEKFLHFQEVVSGKSNNTMISYKKDLDQFVEYLENNEEITSFDKVTKFMLRSFMAYLNDHGINRRSINRKISAVRTLYKYLMRQETVHEDPTVFINLPKYEKKLPSVLSEAEVKKILNEVDTKRLIGVRDKAIIELLFSSGLRASELIDLTLKQINFKEREIRVLGKGNKERITFFSHVASEWMRRYIKESEKKYGQQDEFIFYNKNGTKLSDRSLRRNLSRYAKNAGIDKEVATHTFRHSFATYLLDNNINIRYVQELLGHSSISTTQIYTHVSKEMLKKVYLNTHPFAK